MNLMHRLPIIALIATLLCTTPPATARTRVWIDADPACGTGAANDADDCLAMLYLLAKPDLEVVGISTTFGNTSSGTATLIARTITRLAGADVHVHEGAPEAMPWWHDSATPASVALASELAKDKLTILALGPLTNLAVVLRRKPFLAARIENIYSVMGRAPGHIFHPAEGGTGALFGHGPIFSDFNFEKDQLAATVVMQTGVPVTLVPYVAGIAHVITGDDLRTLSSTGGVAKWVSQRSWQWLGFWQRYIGRNGFAPFDLVMAVAAIEPQSATCTTQHVSIRRDTDIIGWGGPVSMLFEGARAKRGSRPVSVCWSLARPAFEALLETLKVESAHARH